MRHKISSIVVGAVLSALFTADAHANRACCSPDGTCTMVQEREQCANGEIQARGVTCADNPCCEDALAALQQELDQALADLETCRQERDQALEDLEDCEASLAPFNTCGFRPDDTPCDTGTGATDCEPNCDGSCLGGDCEADCAGQGEGCFMTECCEGECPSFVPICPTFCHEANQSCDDLPCCEGFTCVEGDFFSLCQPD